MKISYLFVLAMTALSVTQAGKWRYIGDSGTHYWHELFPAACSGKHQSPIDIWPEETAYNADLKDFAIWYDPPKNSSKMFIKNNGHTVQVDLEGDFYVTNGGLSHVYRAIQFHFHWGHKAHHGSEHLIEGVASPIELHVVTFDNDTYARPSEAVQQPGGLAVLGVMFKISKEDNPVLDNVIKYIKDVRDPESENRVSIPLMSLRDLLPKDLSRYYRYHGSLTTPKCFESVIWTVFDKKQTISLTQLKEFTTLLELKHKHKKHRIAQSDTNSRRRRRHLSRPERAMERHAQEVLLELGIQGDESKESLFRRELEDAKRVQAEETKADNENDDDDDDDDDDVAKLKPKLDENRAAIIDESLDVYAISKTTEKYTTTTGISREGNAADVDGDKKAEEAAEVDYEYRQDYIVNNFRPVQPRNDRVVYRSFHLYERSAVNTDDDGDDDGDDDDDDDGGDDDDDDVEETPTAGSLKRNGNGAGTRKVSAAAAVVAAAALFVMSLPFL